MEAYIEIAGDAAFFPNRFKLGKFEMWMIGDFTRENIAWWLDRGGPIGSGVYEYGWRDFHAVYGDIEIFWTSEAEKKEWERRSKRD